jgi:hypothetical protein
MRKNGEMNPNGARPEINPLFQTSLRAALSLHGDAGGILDLDPDAVRAGSIRAIDPL